jgi:hypothetical protein
MKPSPDTPRRLPQPRTTVGFSVSPREAELIRQKAAENQITLSEYLRQIVLPVCAPER